MTERVFISPDKTATFVCPKCGYAKIADVSQFLNVDQNIKIKATCKCGHKYSVILERRKHIRKKINLPGSYFDTSSGQKGGMSVSDLSRSGLKLRVKGANQFIIGSELRVSFHLDDNLKSLVTKDVVIRKIYDSESIGVEFMVMEHYDELGAYLMFNY